MGLGDQGFTPEIFEHLNIIHGPFFKVLSKMGKDLGPKKRPGHGILFPLNTNGFVQIVFIGVLFTSYVEFALPYMDAASIGKGFEQSGFARAVFTYEKGDLVVEFNALSVLEYF
jgi:hypothetical protein